MSDLKAQCPSCEGLNTSCPVGCDRDPQTGELMPIPPAALARIEQLEAEVRRLRAGLEQIANDPYQFGQRIQKMKELARATLSEGE